MPDGNMKQHRGKKCAVAGNYIDKVIRFISYLNFKMTNICLQIIIGQYELCKTYKSKVYDYNKTRVRKIKV